MACLAPDGSLTESGERILAAISEASTPEQVARTTGEPLYRVRSALRELAAAGLAAESGGRFAQRDAPEHAG
jgi:hypothetical protein